MEVSHSHDRVTHAIMGGGAASAFSMDDSPEFFAVLSDTLYSDKPLATAREVLCNAWDIHIQSGKEAIPVQVTLNSENLIIRDFGPGIAPEMMDVIYCRYGKSTKKHDGKQTGGFGLGSKAPFSYTDHFEVTSCHQGTKTIYKLSKSLPELEGRPGCIPILQVPTDETGLTVKIPLRDASDRRLFKTLIETLSYNGEMNVHLNGVKLNVLPFSSSPHKWVLLRKYRGATAGTPISVRYGNVIYPMPAHEELNPFIKVISDFLDGMPSNDSWRLVLMADPNSISVTPSRESLSMSDHTVKTLGDILEGFCTEFNSLLKAECLNLMNASVNKLVDDGKIKELWEFKKTIPGIKYARNSRYYSPEGTPDLISDFPTIISIFAKTVYPKFPGFAEATIVAQIEGLIRYYRTDGTRPEMISDLLMFLREVKKEIKTGKDITNTWKEGRSAWGRERYDLSNWIHKRVLSRVLTKMKASPEVIPEKLTAYAVKLGDHGYKGSELHPVRNMATRQHFSRRPLLDQLPFLRRIIVVCHRATETHYRIEQFPIMRAQFGDAKDILYYTVPRSPKKVEGAIAFFKKNGFNVIDLTRVHDHEPKATQAELEPLPKPAPKPKVAEGLPLMRDGIKQGSGYRIDSDWWQKCERSTAMETVIQNRQDGSAVTLDWASATQRQWIADNWGSKIGIAVSTTQVEKYQKSGAKAFKTWIIEKFKEEFNKARLLDNVGYTEKHYEHFHDRQSKYVLSSCYTSMYHWTLIDGIIRDPVLAKEFHLSCDLTTYDRGFLDIFFAYAKQHEARHDPDIKGLLTKYANCQTPFALGALIIQVTTGPYVEFMSVNSVISAMSDTRPENSAKRLKAKALLLNLLKG